MGRLSSFLMPADNLSRLRREAAVFTILAALLIMTACRFMLPMWGAINAGVWLFVVSLVTGVEFAYLFRSLGDNRSPAGGDLFPSLGLANCITTFRGVFNAMLIGFLFCPVPSGWLLWMPGALYLVSAVMDFFDGLAARLANQTTVLGETLDSRWDEIGFTAGVILSVRYGQAPVIYLLVGFARYLFMLGIWLRRRQGLAVYDLPPSRFRRPLAGMQMVIIGAILLPVFVPPVTWTVVTIFMIPFLANFLFDWFVVSGQLRPVRSLQMLRELPVIKRAGSLLPLFARFSLVILLASLLLNEVWLGRQPVSVLILAVLAILALAAGVAGRLVALAVMIMAGLGLGAVPGLFFGLEPLHLWLILLVSAVLFLTSTGQFSMWRPEDWLIDHRAGE